MMTKHKATLAARRSKIAANFRAKSNAARTNIEKNVRRAYANESDESIKRRICVAERALDGSKNEWRCAMGRSDYSRPGSHSGTT